MTLSREAMIDRAVKNAIGWAFVNESTGEKLLEWPYFIGTRFTDEIRQEWSRLMRGEGT